MYIYQMKTATRGGAHEKKTNKCMYKMKNKSIKAESRKERWTEDEG